MEKKVQVVMLPISKPTTGQHINLCSRPNVGLGYVYFDYKKDAIRLTKDSKEVMSYIKDCCSPQHLYFTSNEEIKEGDWCIGEGVALPFKAIPTIRYHQWKKIVASTDPSLGLPSIPESFIQQYVAVNGKINSVMLEMENKANSVDIDFEKIYTLKLTDNNECIVINKTKGTFEEGLKQLGGFEEDTLDYQQVLDTIKSLPYKIEKADGQYISATSVHKWDKENDKCLSANGKRLIECNIDPKGTCYFDIREDGNTRYVFNGIITNVEQIVLLEKLTNSFLW